MATTSSRAVLAEGEHVRAEEDLMRQAAVRRLFSGRALFWAAVCAGAAAVVVRGLRR